MARSTLQLTFSQPNKTVTIVGEVAVREVVTVTVKNGATLIGEGLCLKIQSMTNKGATTPIAFFPLEGDSWTTSGSDAVGTLNINTVEALDAFVNVPNLGHKDFNLLLYTTDTDALCCNGVINLFNFPSVVSSNPISIGQQTSIDALEERVTELESQDTVLEGRIVALEADVGALKETAVTFDLFESVTVPTNATLKQLTTAVNNILNKLQGN